MVRVLSSKTLDPGSIQQKFIGVTMQGFDVELGLVIDQASEQKLPSALCGARHSCKK